ncbi:MAG TPA: ATP-dependent RecD-like DNA helicase, partial [Myxococcales bacterium]|nr:ATP-dependent RecD-like DNA helicase [Myxococcales bacterium]
DDALRFAEVISRLVQSRGPDIGAHQIEARIGLANEALGFELAGGQRRAIEDALRSQVMVVTGGPGTGKTTLIQGLLAALTPDGLDVALAAPTGRAARRLTESTGVEASTLHRLLEVDPFTRSFQRDRTRPIEADPVIVDECSMLDISIAKSLADALAPDCRLVLVGDVDQLPSVGPGAVLHDLITSQKLCVTRLDEIHRQASQSSIVRNAHLILAGQPPESDLRDSGGDFFMIPRVAPTEVIETVVQVVQDRLPSRYGFDPLRDIQVLVPTHRGSLGTETLNEALMQALVSDSSPARFGFRVGEKVIQLRNNYDLEIFNGDVGHVRQLLDDGLMVQFGQRTLTIPADQLGDLKRAYAITVHKSQGSEYPAVVLVLHGQHHLMLQQNLIYTALTRARRFCVIVGDPVAVQRAVGRQQAGRRQTLLKHLMLEEIEL